MFDGKAFGAEMTDVVKGYVERITAPLLKRIEELEARQLEKGEPGERGADGIGIADTLIDRDGNLILTFTDGSTKNVGPVVGRDGRDGIDGEQGPPGDPGRDAYAGEARGLFDVEANYRARDVVMINGSSFMAKMDNPGECPGEGWMLLAQRGKTGRPGDKAAGNGDDS